MGVVRDVREVLVTEARFLCFLPVRPDMKRLRYHFLVFALLATWVAGLGRYWDAPAAETWEYWGLGSMLYLLAMSFFLWVVLIPFKPANWSFLRVLTFVGMTAPPAFLYAIPVERLFDTLTAHKVNYIFLIIVAAWRVGLLWFFLRGAARFDLPRAIVATLFPLAIVVFGASLFHLDQIIMEDMAGIRDEATRTPDDSAARVLTDLGGMAFMACPFLFVGYCYLSSRAQREVDAKGVAGAGDTLGSDQD